MLFENLNIIEPIMRALKEEGYEKATPIQAESIPSLLDGRDILGCAQTGTGKTASFAIPVLQRIDKLSKKVEGPRVIKALVLAPTRELAIQIGDSFTAYGKYMNLKNTVIFGGVAQSSQVRKITAGVDILVATPGRLLDLINQKHVDLKNVEYFVLDEADRMLDMGMIHDVKKIISRMPKERQNMLFSATMPKEVTNLVNSILKNPVKVEVTPVSSTVDIIIQGVYFVPKKQKKSLLVHLLKDESITSALVFSRTKHGANAIVKDLNKFGIEAQAIHGNKSQNARQDALKNFKEGKTRVLVATDIAARGIDVDQLSYVVNYDLPEVPETYVHRIGRTGRAGNTGSAYSFCSAEEMDLLKGIEKVINKPVPVMEAEDFKILEDTTPVVNGDAVKNALEKISKHKANSRSNNRGGGRPNNRSKGKSTGKSSNGSGKSWGQSKGKKPSGNSAKRTSV